MASNRSSFQKVGTALIRLLSSFGSQKSESVTTAEEKPADSDSKKTVSSDKQKLVIRKTKKSPFEQRLPRQIQQYCLSFLSGGDTLLFLLASHQIFTTHNNHYRPARVQKALSNLVDRKYVEKTLATIKSKPDIFLDELQHPFKLTVTGYGGQRVTGRPCLVSALDALDEYDVTKPDAKAEPCAAISSIRGLFAKEHPVQAQIDRQIADASSKQHQDATQKRHQRYLNRIRKFILQVIYCDEISNDPKKQKDFDFDMNRDFVQHFINTAFQLNDPENKEEFDNGEFGVVLDAWQLLDDCIYLFNQCVDEQDMIPDTIRDDPTQPILGRYWDRKAWIADSAVYVALHHFALLCHLEVLSSGAYHVAYCRRRLTRFNMHSGDDLKRLVGIGSSHVFGFFSGDKLGRSSPADGGVWIEARWAEMQHFCQTKTAAKNPYTATIVSQEVAFDNEGLSNSSAAIAAR